jgi:NNP family nitrate/nitrite transporter-like MFS transporter
MGQAADNIDSQSAVGAGSAGIAEWNVEDTAFWSRTGKSIATRNLLISIPCLLLAFAIWLYWSIIIVQMQNLGFSFTSTQLYTLPAIAGLAGATLRIPNSFMIAISGGRNVIGITTTLLIIPAAGVGVALQNPNTDYIVFAILAAFSGVGGGAFASSMSNISFFFPKRMQGLSLGLNAGLGNLGVSVMQVLIPWATSLAVFGALSGEGRSLPTELGGATIWIQNGGLVWVPALALFAILAFALMNNLPMHRVGSTAVASAKMLWLEFLGLAGAGIGIGLLLGVNLGLPDLAHVFLVLAITICVTLVFMRFVTPAPVRNNLANQFVIFRKKHNWVMTWLYTMTFGSFIGYSAAFPKLIQDIFGTLPDGTINLNAPNPLHYAWLGPLVGSLVRPVGGWVSDKLGGARVTHWNTVVMIGSALAVASFVKVAGTAAAPETYWWPFFLLFMLLFITTGIGNGSTFRMIPIIFKPELAGPVLGWTSAVAAYGAFLIPRIFGGQIETGTPEYALYGFAGYYVTCLVVNWWFYARKNAEVPC